MDQVSLSVPILGVAAFLFTGIIGTIVYFLKREVNRNDAMALEVKCIKETYARRDELKELEHNSVNQLGKMNEQFTTRFDRIDTEIKAIHEHYITSDVFVREVNKLSNQNERIYGLLFDLTRGGK